MTYIMRQLRLLGALLAAACLVALLGGCGGSEPAADPITGTWRPSSSLGTTPQPIVIARVAGVDLGIDGLEAHVPAYVAILPSKDPDVQGRAHLTRVGDTLTGALHWPTLPGIGASMPPVPIRIEYLPASGHLTWSAASRAPIFSSTYFDGMSKPVEMSKVSDSTRLPTPSP